MWSTAMPNCGFAAEGIRSLPVRAAISDMASIHVLAYLIVHCTSALCFQKPFVITFAFVRTGSIVIAVDVFVLQSCLKFCLPLLKSIQ